MGGWSSCLQKVWGPILLYPILRDSFTITSWTPSSQPTITVQMGTSNQPRISGQGQIQ
uniref:Large S protein n=1 Tax=Hepatitis B virus TaxID=10407 RepID=D2X4F3_HBV|nr:large S protein [Hepatitis B virus]